MITMRNIWIMMLGICLFGCGAAKQPLSSQLSLTWKLEKDSVEARYFKNTFCLTNNGNKSLTNNWVIYFNQTPIYYQQPINAPLEIECLGSTYYKMYPTEHYQALPPGETITFTILSEGNVINVSSVPEGAYVVTTDEKGKPLQPQNVPIEMISELLGHKSIKTTQIYLRSFSLEKMTVVNKSCFENVYNYMPKVG